MESHIKVLDGHSNTSKRSSVGPVDEERSTGEPSLANGSAYARKRPRISDEGERQSLIQSAEPASPHSPVTNPTTQLLFGSSPLTEPEDDFPRIGSDRGDDTDDPDQVVVSSQEAEREALMFDNVAVLPEVLEPTRNDMATTPLEQMPQQMELDLKGEKALKAAEIAIEQQTLHDFSILPSMDVTTIDTLDSNSLDTDAFAVNQDAIAVAQPLSEVEGLEQQPSFVAAIANQKKDVAKDDDESDDEFDTDPWFDAACLRSFDALDTSVAASPTSDRKPVNVPKPSGSGFSLFQTAGGDTLPQVSDEARNAATAILNQADSTARLGTSTPYQNPVPNFGQDGNTVGESFIDTRPPEQVQPHEVPSTVGFSTARGKRVAVPTTAAAAKNARVAKLMQELMDIKNEVETSRNNGVELEEKVDPEPSAEGGDFVPPRLEPNPITAQLPAVFETPTKSGFSAFTTAGGSQLGRVSAAAKASVSSIFAEKHAVTDEPAESKHSGMPVPTKNNTDKASLFATASGVALAIPSAEARKMATSLFDEFGPDIQTKTAFTDYPLQPAHPAVLSLGLPSTSFETPVKSISRPTFSVARVTLAETPKPATGRPTSLQDISNLQPSTPAQQHNENEVKSPLPAKMMHRASQVKPFQTPLPSSRYHMSPAPSTGRGLSPALPRRVGLGMTPRTRSGLVERPRFVSPFRTALRDDVGEGAGSPNLKPRPGMRAIFSTPAVKKERPAARVLQPCFDLTCPTQRKTMIEAALKPNALGGSALSAAGIPREIAAINPVTAQYYTFLHLGILKGPEEVMREFKEEGLALVDIQWVRHHWKMILWKLASIVKAKIELFQEKWNYEEVVRQLKYRYEREINRAERSAVKRIQEQDSPPSLPMILCVSAICTSPADPVSDGPTAMENHMLELTDGWYTIRANVDAPLNRALKAGKLRVGSKIAIAGAKLDAAREGTEVMQALDKSSLRITGNSTCLVEWYRPLGFTHRPFSATLRSLSPDGGNIPLLDIRISKLFPLAYISTEKGKGASPWSAEEEYKLQDEWNERYMQERSRLQAEGQRQLRGSEEDVERLRSAIEGLDGSTDAYACEDEELERFREASNKSQYLKSLSSSALLSLFLKAQEHLQSEMSSAQAEVEDQIRRLCPPRSTKSFQIIRIVDAGVLQHAQLREAQLQVWDAKLLGDNMLQEGVRYQVSNLVPAQQKAWCSFRDKGEIYLGTSKATTWKRSDV